MINFIKGSWKDLLIGVFLVSFAAFLNASMDTIQFHYNKSVYSKMGSYFYKDWTRVYEKDPVTGEIPYDENGDHILVRKKWDLGLFTIGIHPLFFDAWHLFKSSMIFLIILFGVTFIFAQERKVFGWKNINDWYLLITLISLYSIIWNLTFYIFYDKLLLL